MSEIHTIFKRAFSRTNAQPRTTAHTHAQLPQPYQIYPRNPKHASPKNRRPARSYPQNISTTRTNMFTTLSNIFLTTIKQISNIFKKVQNPESQNKKKIFAKKYFQQQKNYFTNPTFFNFIKHPQTLPNMLNQTFT